MALAMTSLPVPVSPSMRTVESVGATVRTRSSVSIRAVLHPTIPSNACCLERFSLAKLMPTKLCASGKAIPGLPILHPPTLSLHSVLTTSTRLVKLCSFLSWSMERTPPCGQPQMEFRRARSEEVSFDTTLVGVGDNSTELRYRDASCQKGARRSTERQARGLRGRYLTLPSR